MRESILVTPATCWPYGNPYTRIPEKINGSKMIRARDLRKTQTDAESALWAELRSRQLSGHRFKRQHPIGPYIVDFVCLESNLVVELDGGQQQVSIKYDSARTDYLNQHGFSVIRFWNNQVLTEINGVKEAILLSLTIQIEKPDPPQILSLTRKSELF